MIMPQTIVIPGSHLDGRNFLRTRFAGHSNKQYGYANALL